MRPGEAHGVGDGVGEGVGVAVGLGVLVGVTTDVGSGERVGVRAPGSSATAAWVGMACGTAQEDMRREQAMLKMPKTDCLTIFHQSNMAVLWAARLIISGRHRAKHRAYESLI